MATAAKQTRDTPEEYLALERRADYKSEYYDGSIYAMAGASREHNLIAGNLFREISSQLRGRPCEAYVNVMRVDIATAGAFAYPDVVVVCGEPRFRDNEFDTLLNPTVIIEVLSPSTEAHDRGEKFARYRRIESLREYVLVAQTYRLVERFRRRGDEWVLNDWEGPEDALRLDSIGCEVPLREIYDRVEFPPVDAPSMP